MIGYLKAVTARKLGEFLSCTHESEVKSLLYPEQKLDDDTNSLDLEKTWHGLHFLLTGDSVGSPPHSWVIFGNYSVGGDDNQLLYGYSFIGLRYLLPDEVSTVAKLLTSITVEDLKANFLPKVMQEVSIYPDIWTRDGEDALNWLLGYYPYLVSFYQKAASEKKAVLMYVD
jgi:Domain of unknown function (DUF1877)